MWCAKDGQESPPNYLSDESPRKLLNDAEARLTFSQRIKYRENLQGVCSEGLPNGEVVVIGECISASARQRVIALLLTVKPELFL